MVNLKFTRAAKGDLKEIGKYTKRKWGELQQKRYLDSLVARCHWLGENPGLGTNRDEVAEGYRSYPEGQHIIFFRVQNQVIQILRIPHQRMDTLFKPE